MLNAARALVVGGPRSRLEQPPPRALPAQAGNAGVPARSPNLLPRPSSSWAGTQMGHVVLRPAGQDPSSPRTAQRTVAAGGGKPGARLWIAAACLPCLPSPGPRGGVGPRRTGRRWAGPGPDAWLARGSALPSATEIRGGGRGVDGPGFGDCPPPSTAPSLSRPGPRQVALQAPPMEPRLAAPGLPTAEAATSFGPRRPDGALQPKPNLI